MTTIEEKNKSISVEQEFYDYLKNVKNMAESSCRSFISSIHSAEKFAKKNNYSSIALFSEDVNEAEVTNRELIDDPAFQELDREKNFRFSNAISKLMVFYHTRK